MNLRNFIGKFWGWGLKWVEPSFPARYRFESRIGFRVDSGNRPLCPICLGEGKEVPGTYDGNHKMVCPEHKVVTGARPVDELPLELRPNTPKIWLSYFTALAFEINAVYDATPNDQPTFDEIYDATDRQQLVKYLANRYGSLTDLSFVSHQKDKLEILEAALCDAAEALRGRESRKTGVKSHGFSLLQAIVLEAIQQQYSRFIFDAVEAREKQGAPPK